MTHHKWKVACGVAVVGLTLWLVGAGTGCRLGQGTADPSHNAVRVTSSGKSKAPTKDPTELQQQLLRFVDQYLAKSLAAVEDLESADPQATRETVQRIRISYAADLWMAAAGPNPYANLLDLITAITLSRIVIEDYWMPEVFGDSAKPLLEVVRTAEKDIWAIAAGVLNADQQEELRETIRIWREENPEAVHAMYVRAAGLAGWMAEARPRDRDRPTSVFRFLMLDPLSGLDPTTRELTQTRLAAERAMYVAQRLPFMVRWQMELWSVHMAEMPETRQLLTNSTQMADAAVRLSRTAEELPDRFSQERRQIVETLQAEQQNLRELSSEVGSTLNAGSHMASNAHVALDRFDTVVQRLQAASSDSNAAPFRIHNYTEAAKQLDAAALHLSDLLQQLDESLASTNLHELVEEVGPVVKDVESSGRDLVDHAFKKLLLLLVIACGLFLVTAVLHRRLANRGPGAGSPG